MDRYMYLEYTILLDECILARLGKFAFLIAHIQNTITQTPIKFFDPFPRRIFISSWCLISTLSTYLVL